MRCEKVLGCLSLFMDDMLDEQLVVPVTRHVGECLNCRKELSRLKNLKTELGCLETAEAPAYLRDLVGHQIENANKLSWRRELRSELEYGWSRIRTIEGRWYLARLTGALATLVFFIAISAAMSPEYLGFESRFYARTGNPGSQMLAVGMQRVFGSTVEAQKRPIRSSEPRINDEYLANFAQKVSRSAQNDTVDTVSVVAMVDGSGAAKVKDILEYPSDDSLLSEFTEMINSAGWRPASQNGRAVNSPLVLTFTKICVYN